MDLVLRLMVRVMFRLSGFLTNRDLFVHWSWNFHSIVGRPSGILFVHWLGFSLEGLRRSSFVCERCVAFLIVKYSHNHLEVYSH